MWLFQEREAIITNTFLMGSVTLKYIRNHWPRRSMFIFVLNRMVFIILIMKLIVIVKIFKQSRNVFIYSFNKSLLSAYARN